MLEPSVTQASQNRRRPLLERRRAVMSTGDARLTPAASALIRFSALVGGPICGPASCACATEQIADELALLR
jgi:hypothetical protein